MTEESSGPSPGARRSAWIVFAMLMMVVVPAALTLNTVRWPGTLQIPSEDPAPYGYTWSLMLFIVPIAVIALWFLPREGVVIPKRAFWWTLGLLVPTGFALDFFLAHVFFVFPNAGATLRIGAPALGGPVPIEEYLFYLTGFVTVLLLYVWLDEFWLAAYNVPDYPSAAGQIDHLLRFHPFSLILGATLIAVAIVYKKFFSAVPQGFPGYFTFLITVAFVPSAGFFPTARQFINWRALSLAVFLITLISLLWEVTLAAPYGWWGYQANAMMGIFVGAWSGLPIEAVFVWIAVTYSTAFIFEIVKLWLASGKGVREGFLGTKRP
jgi:hypothetical protein